MQNKLTALICAGLVALCCFLPACGKREKDPELIVVRLADDPGGLNPLLTRSSLAVQIAQKIFLPLADFDPFTLELVPVLVDSLGNTELVTDGPYTGTRAFSFHILPQASWDDGSPVTAEDYAFTLKTLVLMDLYGISASGMHQVLRGVETDPSDNKRFTVYADPVQTLAELYVSNIPILPAKIYDPDGVMSKYPLGRLLEMAGNQQDLESKTDLAAFAERFAGAGFARDIVSGSGPYRLKEWQSGQYVRLERKAPYWADGQQLQRFSLIAHPKELLYRIIPDEQAAIQALKDGVIDVMGDFSPEQYAALQKDQGLADSVRLYTPDVLQYYFVCLNTRRPALSEFAVRRALAHLMPVESVIDQLFLGLAGRLTGPIHPAKSYYNSDLSPIPYDTEEAIKLLDEAGWTDSNGDGTRDKEIGGQRIELSLELLTSQRKLGQDLALVFQESAAKAGIAIRIRPVDNPTLLTEVSKHQFDMANLAGRFAPGPDELFISWHTAAVESGSNFSGFGDQASDSLIIAIQENADPGEKARQYREFQQMVYDRQPVIFLVAPKERIAARASLELEPSVIRPGYFENLFQVNGSK